MIDGRIRVWLPAVRAGTGADVFTRRLAQGLARIGIASEITWFGRGDELLPLRLKSVAAPPGTDIVLANSWIGHAVRRSGLPLVAVVHHAGFAPELAQYKSCLQRGYHNVLARPREARSLRSADAVVAVSAHVAEWVERQYGISGVRVIHNWVNSTRFSPAPSGRREGHAFRLLYAGKPTPIKGADLLRPIMQELGLGFELDITADAETCERLHFPAGIRPLGWLDEKALIDAYRQCDALLCTSRAEGFGYVALEAMACGKPVIASRVGGLGEIVQDGHTGVLCNPGDVGQFVDACRRLAADDALCRNMGTHARRHAEQFSEAEAIEAYGAVIRALV